MLISLRTSVVARLGTAQTLAWASSYYLPAMLATSMAADLGVSVTMVLHGAGNGILTIAKGTLPLVIFGPQGYGARQGLLMVPARVAQAFAPLVFGLAIDQFGGGALWLSTGVGLVGLVALVWLQRSGSVVRPRPAGSAGS